MLRVSADDARGVRLRAAGQLHAKPTATPSALNDVEIRDDVAIFVPHKSRAGAAARGTVRRLIVEAQPWIAEGDDGRNGRAARVEQADGGALRLEEPGVGEWRNVAASRARVPGEPCASSKRSGT